MQAAGLSPVPHVEHPILPRANDYLLLVQLGVLFVWLANGSGGSILIAILAHAGFNVAVGLAPESLTRDAVAFIVVTTATIAVIAATRGQVAFTEAGTAVRPPERVPIKSP